MYLRGTTNPPAGGSALASAEQIMDGGGAADMDMRGGQRQL
jgi:hypothetical protein